MSTLRERVGHAIRHQRKLRSWSQEELATLTGRSIEMINRLERGRIAPSFETLEKLEEVFQVPVGEFFGLGAPTDDPQSDDALMNLIRMVAKLDPDDIDWINDLVAVALSRKQRSSP
ncbi:MAG: helix-turn-helix transcriptional regulator [Phenylobacterium sp.]|uniref:helix-turn-helix domain-containing protein n=1 Tax=Phenylobacterium sp. TaxID=1871053 RepID=UPI0025E30EFA|nr:helix-turn-helix transcriptional regulator [Phenylobacterium sp.]MCA6244509.1 helix-turn-helix transcriptional regulator [Phenylobacterium sp.]